MGHGGFASYQGPSFSYNSRTSRGTIDGKPLLVKRPATIAYRCCDVLSEGLITERCWNCGMRLGEFKDKLHTKDALYFLSGCIARMGFSEPRPNEVTTVNGVKYEPGHWNRRCP